MDDTKDCLKSRHILGILGFLGFANVYAMRVNLSVAIVAMVNNTAFPPPNVTSHDICPVPNMTNSTIPVDVSNIYFSAFKIIVIIIITYRKTVSSPGMKQRKELSWVPFSMVMS